MATKRRAETAQENREKLIHAARKAFAEKGFAAASMDELTASVGLARGALYHNFRDKKGLGGGGRADRQRNGGQRESRCRGHRR